MINQIFKGVGYVYVQARVWVVRARALLVCVICIRVAESTGHMATLSLYLPAMNLDLWAEMADTDCTKFGVSITLGDT